MQYSWPYILHSPRKYLNISDFKNLRKLQNFLIHFYDTFCTVQTVLSNQINEKAFNFSKAIDLRTELIFINFNFFVF